MKRFDYLDYLCAEIYLHENDVQEICHSGPNDADVVAVSAKNYVIEQFAKFSDDELFDAVKKLVLYDAVSPEEYPHNRQESIQWLVWHLAWNILDEMIE